MKKYLLLLLLTCSIGNAQYNLFARQNFAFKAISNGTNTEIGGVASTISTPALLASKLGISVGAISNFTIVGSDIKCKITGGNYAVPVGAFLYEGTPSFTNPPCTYYNDVDGLVTSLGSDSFKSRSLKWVCFKNVISVGTGCFADGSGTKRDFVYIPNCTNLGGSTGDDNVFIYGLQTKIIYCHPSLATNNAGAEDGDLAYARSQGVVIRFVSNFTAPNSVTTLAAGNIYNTAIQLNFTAPSSTNTIDYYEVYLNGVFKNKISGSSEYITGLSETTSYNITLIARDIFYNKSVISNSISVTTTANLSDADAIAYTTASSNTTYQYAINDLFKGLKDNSIYTKLQAFYPFLGTAASQHKFNAKNPVDTDAGFRLVFSGTGTYSNSGFQSNGLNAYADTKFVPSVRQSVNSNGITIVSGTDNSADARLPIECGNYQLGTQSSLVAIKWENTNEKRIRMNGGALTTLAYSQNKGILTANKQSATVTTGVLNGVKIITGNSGGTLPTIPLFIGAGNIFGSASQYSNQRIQGVYFHEGLSDSEVVTLHTIINTFENALGRKTW